MNGMLALAIFLLLCIASFVADIADIFRDKIDQDKMMILISFRVFMIIFSLTLIAVFFAK